MRIAILCATHRGYLFVEKLAALAPDSELLVFSFPEEPWEPCYLDDIRALTLAKGGQFFVTKQVGSAHWQSFWATTPIDLLFAVSWRYLIPPSVYQRPRLGSFVFHDSLLPAYRGFSPTVWSIINGEDHTGVTLFAMTGAVDEGDVIAQKPVPIGPDDTIAGVMEEVTQTYLALLAQNLDGLRQGTAPRCRQDQALASYTSKRLPTDNEIDWTASTIGIYNLIRAVTRPYPGAYTYLCGKKLTIWRAKRLTNPPRYVGRIPGRVVAVRPGEGTVVLTGDGSLLVTEVQIEGDKVVCAPEILNSLSQTLGVAHSIK